MIRSSCWGIAAVLIFGLVCGIFGAGLSPAFAAPPDGTLAIGVHVTLVSRWLDPAETEALITPFMVLYALHDGLVKPMPGGISTPSLAESWTVSKDGITYEFVLRKGAKFHNGQIVGGYELPANAPAEAAQAYLDSKRFVPTPVDGASPGAQHYRAEYPNLYVPPIAPASTTQIIVVLQLHIAASRRGEWDVRVTLHPGPDGEYSCELPRARVTAMEQGWLPVVSGLNPKAAYDTADIVC